MSKYERLLHEINLLKSRQGLFASDLAKECVVSRRTIYRDILSLSASGIPVYFDNGYKILSDAFFPTLNFTPDEYQVLRVALTSPALLNGGSLSKSAKNVLAKIKGNLSTKVKDEIKDSPDELKICEDNHSNHSPNPLFFNLIKQAISNSYEIRLKYKMQNHQKAQPVDIKPYSLVYLDGSWKLLGFCESNPGYHLFDLGGIKKVMVLDKNFERKKDFNLNKVLNSLQNTFNLDPSKKSFEVKVRFSKSAKKYLRSKKHHPVEKVWLAKNGEIIYTAKVNRLDEILSWVLGFGDKARVLEPSALREKVKKTASKIKSFYL